MIVAGQILAPESERDNWSTRWALRAFEGRRGLVERQLERARYMAGDNFTAADISVTYALELAQRTGSASLSDAGRAYLSRTTDRDGYRRAMDVCHATREWVASLTGDATTS